MRRYSIVARCAALPFALAVIAGTAAVAQTAAPLVTAQAVSPEEANRRGDNAFDRKDYAEAMRWYRQAADQGYPTGEANIGYLYSKGFGVKQDFGEAVYWYRRAAEKGQVEAQHNLGLRYANGEGVPRDMAKARYWMEKSAANGDDDAKKWLATH